MTARRWTTWSASVALGAGCGAMVVIDVPAHRLAWALAVAVPVLAAAGIGLVRGLQHREAQRPVTAAVATSTVGLAASERAVYFRRVTNPVLALVGIAMAGVLFASGTALEMIGALAWLYLVAGVACVRVHIDTRGVKVTAWPLGRPQRWVPLERIIGARQVQVGRHWLWGLRWVATDRTWAFLVYGRHALEVTIDSGEALLVTVPDALLAAGLVNDLLARTGQP